MSRAWPFLVYIIVGRMCFESFDLTASNAAREEWVRISGSKLLHQTLVTPPWTMAKPGSAYQQWFRLSLAAGSSRIRPTLPSLLVLDRPCTRSFSSTSSQRSGHNRWSKIKHKKGAADMQRGAQFSRVTQVSKGSNRIRGRGRRCNRRSRMPCGRRNPLIPSTTFNSPMPWRKRRVWG